MARIAIIEDDSDIAFATRINLEREGHAVDHFTSGHEALLALQAGAFDLAILDLNLPDLDGLTICRELRRSDGTRDLPILMLTARAAEADRVTGLELGADDYLTKPFSPRELVARIAAILRRSVRTSPSERYEDDTLTVDASTLKVLVHGEEVHFARKEFELLWMLIRNAPAVVSRDRLLDEIWQAAEGVETRTVDAHIRNLRRKIGKDRISTVIGYGYRFERRTEQR